MDILNLLKQLKSIEPDQDYKRKSRYSILGLGRKEKKLFNRIPVGFIFDTLTQGSSIALVAVFLIILLGGFSAIKFLSPLGIVGLDSGGLKAEAEAIDIQIHLTDLNYGSADNLSSNESTAALLSEDGKNISGSANNAKNEIQKKAQDLGLDLTKSGSVSEDDKLTIDEALQKLSE